MYAINGDSKQYQCVQEPFSKLINKSWKILDS